MDVLILMSVYMTMLFYCGREELEQQQKKLEYLLFIFLWQ